MPARWIPVAIAAALVTGCGRSAHVAPRPGALGGLEPIRGARAGFDPAAFDEVFRKALHAIRAQGFTVVACDAELGVIGTSRVEVDAPCGGTTCLARETAAVKLGFRRARVTVTREVWDSTLRGWRVPDDDVSVAAIARTERELLAAASGDHPGPTPDVSCVCAEGDCIATSDPAE
jgi:hypothetical protein